MADREHLLNILLRGNVGRSDSVGNVLSWCPWSLSTCLESHVVKLHSHSRTASRSEASYLGSQHERRSCDLAKRERTGQQWISVSVLHAAYLHPFIVCVEDHIHITAYRESRRFSWIREKPISNLERTQRIPIGVCHSFRQSFLASGTTFTKLRHDRFLSYPIFIHYSSIQSLEDTA